MAKGYMARKGTNDLTILFISQAQTLALSRR
jgi:hypothetical protein